ncbi:MAG: VWA domain-containing protein [Vicinamibacterales bacterium]
MVACALLSSEIVGGRQDPPPRFKTGIHVVEVDATVFDAAGRPVRGLTASDFSVRENGESRRIVAVTEVSIPVGPPDAVASSPRHDVANNQAPEGRLLVLFIDDATIPPDPAMVKAAKDIAWGAVERMGPADVMSVVFTGHTNHAQDFTRDRSRLRRAIDRTTVGFDISEHTKGTLRLWGASFRTLLNIAESLRDVPRHRKAILYVSIGIPGGAVDLVREWRRVTQSSPGSNTPIYAFDPSGVGGLEAFNATHPSSRVGGNPNGFREFLRDVSANTGGRAAVLMNTYDRSLDRLFEDTASYYLIGYETPQAADDGRFRRLDVRTTRPGTTARTRPFFFSPKASSRSSSRRGAPSGAYGAVASAIPVGDLPMRAMAAPFAGSRRDDATVAVVIALRHPAAGTRQHRLDLVTGAFEDDGRQRVLQHQEATVRLAEGTDLAVYEVTTSVRLKPGRYRLRVGAYNRALQQSGSVFLDVDVPDFSKEHLSLSGLVLGTSAAPKQAVVQGMRSTLPMAVSTMREFSRSDTVTGFLRVYQGGSADLRPVQVSVRVLDQQGTSVEPAERALLPEHFSRSRSTDVSFPVPVDRLASGSYALQVEVTAPDLPVATRELAFVVR